MRTKYILHIGDESHELTSECIRNWDQIVCAYSRKDYNGVVRSFSSKFEFVNRAYDLLISLYLSDGVCSKAVLEVLTITDRWEWETQFEAPLDFSTITWDDNILSISAIDNSLAALISSNQNTKYEFRIGEDIMADGSLNYDRIIMQNTVTHEIMGNTDDDEYDDGCVTIADSRNIKNALVYVVGDGETYENNPVSYEDQKEDDGSYFIRVENSAEILTIETVIDFDGHKFNGSVISDAEFHLVKFDIANPGTKTQVGTIFKYTENSVLDTSRTCLGCFPTVEAMMKYPNPPQDVFAVIGKSTKYKDAEAVYFTPVTNTGNVEWIQGEMIKVVKGAHRGQEQAFCLSRRFINRFSLEKPAVGTCFAIRYKSKVEKIGWSLIDKFLTFGIRSSIKTSWKSRAKSISIDALKPQNVAQKLLNRIAEGVLNVSVHIDESDERIPKTYIFAGESIRGIPSAKLYTSFKEFCEWMQTVFGYVYYLGDLVEGEITEDGERQPDRQDIYFVHRDSLFTGETVKTIPSTRELKYSVDKSSIYNSIEVGYDKQDYEATCGRDEWNFTSEFSTGISVSDKKFSLKSKYRADCYGFEFLAQKRSQDTTDDKSDKTVFFAYCSLTDNTQTDEEPSTRGDGTTDEVEMTNYVLAIDRSARIEGALTDTVFNGEYTPHRCLKANASLLCAMKNPLSLSFASSDGNSEVVIDGIPGNSSLELTSDLFSVGQLTFNSGDVTFPEDVNALYSVESRGVRYRGYLMSLDLKYARSEVAKYKLIVKDIEPCL